MKKSSIYLCIWIYCIVTFFSLLSTSVGLIWYSFVIIMHQKEQCFCVDLIMWVFLSIMTWPVPLKTKIVIFDLNSSVDRDLFLKCNHDSLPRRRKINGEKYSLYIRHVYNIFMYFFVALQREAEHSSDICDEPMAWC